MIRDDVRDLADVLTKERISFVVVGGASLERRWSIGTLDIDVALALEDYPVVLERLREHPRFRDVEDPALPIAGCRFLRGTRSIDVEFISPAPFSGTRPADDFIGYVRRHRSRTEDGIPFADPEVVWYMRLAISDWEVYVQKILRDARAGVPLALLDKVLDMAAYFGNLEAIAPRVEEARRMLRLRGIVPEAGAGDPGRPDGGGRDRRSSRSGH